jgi:reverse gyrase
MLTYVNIIYHKKREKYIINDTPIGTKSYPSDQKLGIFMYLKDKYERYMKIPRSLG